MKTNLLGLLGGGSRKNGLLVLIALIGAIPLALGRVTWLEYVHTLRDVAIAVALMIGLEDYGTKRARGGPSAVAIATETHNARKSSPSAAQHDTSSPGAG